MRFQHILLCARFIQPNVYFLFFPPFAFVSRRFEDGESDGIRLPDNSVRKTLRCRSINADGTDPLERRKSRRHSTGGNAPQVAVSVQSMSKYHSSPVQNQTLDEDSSSSANSGEINDVFGVSKGPHESAGVTPGLRRRRERAERQKSFMREQQEAAAAGIRPFDMKDVIGANNNNNNINSQGMYSSRLSPVDRVKTEFVFDRVQFSCALSLSIATRMYLISSEFVDTITSSSYIIYL